MVEVLAQQRRAAAGPFPVRDPVVGSLQGATAMSASWSATASMVSRPPGWNHHATQLHMPSTPQRGDPGVDRSELAGAHPVVDHAGDRP